MPIGAPVIARTDTLDAQGWRVYRVTPSGGVIYDEWIDHDSTNPDVVIAQLRAAAARSPEASLEPIVATSGA